MTTPGDVRVCYLHPDRPAGVLCQRCGRPICAEDMREASVGFQCPPCVKQGRSNVRQPRTLAGGAISLNPGSLTVAIIAINVIVHFAVMASGGYRSPLMADGSMWGVAVAHDQYWRLLTSAFLHSGLAHLGFNMFALYLFGPSIEQVLGRTRFLVSYVTVAVAASVFVYWLSDPMVRTVGASGAVFGLFGVALVFMVRSKQNLSGMIALLAINAFISLQGNISWQGHLGGFVTGCLIGAMFAWAPRERRTQWQTMFFVGLWVVMAAAVVLRTATLI